MKKLILGFLVVALSGNALADEFCDGFEEGYRMVKGSNVILPICPIEPITPIRSTSYREGIRAGIRRARR